MKIAQSSIVMIIIGTLLFAVILVGLGLEPITAALVISISILVLVAIILIVWPGQTDTGRHMKDPVIDLFNTSSNDFRLSLHEFLGDKAGRSLENLEIEELIKRTVEYSAYPTHLDQTAFLKIENHDCVITHARGDMSALTGHRFDLNVNVHAKLVEEQTVVLTDLRTLSSREPESEFPAVLVPLGFRNLALFRVDDYGFLLRASSKSRAVSAENLSGLKSSARQLTMILNIYKRLIEGENQAEESARLLRFVKRLAKEREPLLVLDDVLQWTIEFLGAAGGAIMRVDQRTLNMQTIATKGEFKFETVAKVGDGMLGWVAEKQTPVVVESMSEQLVGTMAESLPFSAYFPIVVETRTVAVVHLVFLSKASVSSKESLMATSDVVQFVMSLVEPFGRANQVWSKYIDTLEAVAGLHEFKDQKRYGHSRRVKDLAHEIGRQMGLSDDYLRMLDIASFIHGFGSLVLKDKLAAETRRLTEKELVKIRRHASIAADVVNSVPDLSEAALIVRHRYERYDGKGDGGLKGTEIPIGARILAVADAFQAMTLSRPHAEPLTKDEAELEIDRCAGFQFDPEIVQATMRVLK